jgi:hypothetical protein
MNYGHMDNFKVGGFINKPLILDGTNYEYWKARMVAFLKFMDRKTWKVVIKCWEHPVVMEKDEML